eukprot:SAG11_NODE_10738_length_808_cov_8.249647_1_plen_73_part_00
MLTRKHRFVYLAFQIVEKHREVSIKEHTVECVEEREGKGTVESDCAVEDVEGEEGGEQEEEEEEEQEEEQQG